MASEHDSSAPSGPAERDPIERSRAAYGEALRYIPGGVNSPVRAFKAVGGQPLFVSHGAGSHIFDVDGNDYIDYVCSWGPLVLGHCDPDVRAAVEEAVRRGFTFGAPTELETTLARMIAEAMPSIAKVRMVTSGTEAAMSAIRLARACTRRELVIKFEGCYHGHVDSMLVSAGSGLMTLGNPSSAGIPREAIAHTTVLPYNDVETLEEFFGRRGELAACVIVEPVAGNMGVIAPEERFLKRLRTITEEYGALLIFDEVITGFRLAKGGAQQVYDVRPDMTILGKIIGGGFPVGAYGGPAAIMDLLAPDGPVYQAGTLAGNPIAMAAGIATIRKLIETDAWRHLDERARHLASGLTRVTEDVGIATCLNQVGSMMSLFFTEGPVENFRDAARSNTTRFDRFFNGMLKRGIWLPPSQFESLFLSTAHTEADVDRTIAAAAASLKEVR